MRIARGEQGFTLRRRQLVRRAVAAGGFDERERAVIDDEVLLEKIRSCLKSFGEQTPQPFAADFAARTVKPEHRPLGMFQIRLADFRRDPEPIAHRGNLAKGHARLCHAEGARIHAEKNHALGRFAEAPEIKFVRGPGVIQRVVNVGNGRRKTQFADGIAKAFGRIDERLAHGRTTDD